jgi:hypothetical protein
VLTTISLCAEVGVLVRAPTGVKFDEGVSRVFEGNTAGPIERLLEETVCVTSDATRS